MDGRALAYVIMELSALLDTGLYDGLSIQDIHDHIDRGDILKFVADIGGSDTDFSIILKSKTYGEFEREYTERIQSLANAYGGDERRKWGIENRGLCLLISWTAQFLRESDTHWPA